MKSKQNKLIFDLSSFTILTHSALESFIEFLYNDNTFYQPEDLQSIINFFNFNNLTVPYQFPDPDYYLLRYWKLKKN